MARSKILSYLVLYPISLIYGAAVGIRNWMFNHDILKSRKFDIPVIAIGNLSMGGTGKTPHTEYVVEALQHSYKVAVLSRGYKRRSKGFVKADPLTGIDDIGDEPMQMYRKFGPKVTVAVCESRTKGIDRLMEEDPKLNIIVLDDAFQHRYVEPRVSIVLTDYSRPVFNDHILPFGRLREPASSLSRADIVVVTKCPVDIKPIEMSLFSKHLHIYPYQKLLFSTFVYGAPVPIFPRVAVEMPGLSDLTPSDTILSLTGIDNPRPFLRYLRRECKAKLKIKRYGDHHSYTDADLRAIVNKFESMNGKRRFILTTEKDAVKLDSLSDFPEQLKPYIFYIPVSVKFIRQSSDQMEFDDTLLQIIRDKKRNSI